jgi:hypothetical protein
LGTSVESEFEPGGGGGGGQSDIGDRTVDS